MKSQELSIGCQNYAVYFSLQKFSIAILITSRGLHISVLPFCQLLLIRYTTNPYAGACSEGKTNQGVHAAMQAITWKQPCHQQNAEANTLSDF